MNLSDMGIIGGAVVGLSTLYLISSSAKKILDDKEYLLERFDQRFASMNERQRTKVIELLKSVGSLDDAFEHPLFCSMTEGEQNETGRFFMSYRIITTDILHNEPLSSVPTLKEVVEKYSDRYCQATTHRHMSRTI